MTQPKGMDIGWNMKKPLLFEFAHASSSDLLNAITLKGWQNLALLNFRKITY